MVEQSPAGLAGLEGPGRAVSSWFSRPRGASSMIEQSPAGFNRSKQVLSHFGSLPASFSGLSGRAAALSFLDSPRLLRA
jgi:hypothetical protein